jgi:hypothetical protein
MGTAVLGEKNKKSKLQPNGLKFTKFKIHLQQADFLWFQQPLAAGVFFLADKIIYHFYRKKIDFFSLYVAQQCQNTPAAFGCWSIFS